MTSPFDDYPFNCEGCRSLDPDKSPSDCKSWWCPEWKGFHWRERHEEEILQAYDGARRLDAIRNLYLDRSQSEDVSPLDLLTFFNMVGEILGEV